MRKLLLLLLTLFATSAFAQLGPGTPLRIIIGYPPGGMDATPSPSPRAFATEVAAEGPKREKLMQAFGARIDRVR